MESNPTIHAAAVLAGAKGVLIRGPSGSGKSRLAWDLIEAAARDDLPFARLVADDRLYVAVHNGRLLVRPAPQLAGLIEVHGLGIRRVLYEPIAAVDLVVDLASPDGARMPAADKAELAGVHVPRLPVSPGIAALPLVLAWLRTTPAGD
jgi:serine kinase of HPr protein (carbohydrate metabolism regulator)